MIAARDRNGVKLMIGQSTRFQPAYAMAARLVERGEIGTPVALQAQFAVSATAIMQGGRVAGCGRD